MATTANTPPHGNATPAPDHMTGAELQTLREAAGLSREALAELVGVQARTVKHWESGRAGVPADVACITATMTEFARETGQRIYNEQVQQASKTGIAVLIRYNKSSHMHSTERIACQRSDIHGAAVAYAANMLEAEATNRRRLTHDQARILQRVATDADEHFRRDMASGAPYKSQESYIDDATNRYLSAWSVRVVWFDQASFVTWCHANGADDTPASRSEWARAAALPAQAIPPRGDQPPTDFVPGYSTPSTGTTQGRSRP